MECRWTTLAVLVVAMVMSDKELAALREWAMEAKLGNMSYVQTERMRHGEQVLVLLDEIEAWKRTANTLANRINKNDRAIHKLYWGK